jgi:predicted chitinase/peptidoglycan hydrolase-like protein with peptidoglycan-binding domain
MTFVPTRDELARMFPRALPDWLDAMGLVAPSLISHYRMTPCRWAHFCGQIAAETDGLSLKSMAENMNFTSASRILEVYGYRLGLAVKKGGPIDGRVFKSKVELAAYLKGKPKLLADVVYGGREGTPWMMGSRYLGRGPLQTTHRNNYKSTGEEIARQPGGGSYNLVETPELLATDPELGIRAAFAEWKIKGLDKYADEDSCDLVSDLLNTGNTKDKVKPHGLDRRRRETARAKAIWLGTRTRPSTESPSTVISEGSRGPLVAELQKRLAELGYQLGKADGIWGTLTTRAVLAFQSEHGMELSGRIDMAEGSSARVALAATVPAPLGARASMTALDLGQLGSTQVKLWSRVKVLGGWAWKSMFGIGAAEASGLDVLDNAASVAERMATFIGKAAPYATGPKAWLVLAMAVVALGGWLLSRWASEGIADRVAKAQTGADISI